MLCPNCYKDAPIVYRGVSAHCTACGAVRVPLANQSVNMAGQPSKVGGAVAKAFGWLTLAGGTVIAAITAAFFQWLITDGIVGWVLGGLIFAITAVISAVLLVSGKQLTKSGDDTHKTVQEKAILGLVQNSKGVVTALDVSRSLDITLQEADAVLTRMAKETPDQITVDVDDQGQIFYRFPQVHWDAADTVRIGGGFAPAPGVAPNPQPVQAPRQRVAGEAWDDPEGYDEAAEEASRQAAARGRTL